ncbi:MAG: zinc-ribbon domain-containing protein [Acutalibacteraceae bacterium]
MKSVKPGRGPSMIGGIIGIAVALFGVFWTILAIRIGGGFILVPFGIIFVVIAVVIAVYNFKNATGKNRYSEYDITDNNEEPDPWNERFGKKNNPPEVKPNDGSKANFCPYCGEKADKDFEFCKNCGRKLP